MAISELVNAGLFIVALFIYWRKVHQVDTFFVLLLAYGFTAIMCLLYQNSGESTYQTSILSYFYMFLCFWICLSPFKNMEIDSTLYIKETRLIKLLTWMYIITGIVSIYYTLPNAIMIIQSGDYFEIRNSLYQGEEASLYHSQLERLCKNISSYLSPFGIVMGFYQLVKPDRKWYIVIPLLGTWLVNTFLGATLIASRGIVAVLILRVLLVFVIFKAAIPSKIQKIFIGTIGVLCIPVFFYLMAVSVSRFGEANANSSIFMYLGHAMQNLNENCIGAMHSFAWGKYALSYFGSILGFSFGPDDFVKLGYTGGTGFYTFLGAFYIDFGPIFTVLFCALLSVFIKKYTTKYSKSFSDLIIIVYFATFFINGIFVTALGYAIQWIMLWVVYEIVKIAEK